jgi:3-dehydroquinate dehydratase-2
VPRHRRPLRHRHRIPSIDHEGVVVDWIHEAYAKKADGIAINAAGFTTTSVSIMDALLAVKLPVIEVHMTNIHAREAFRHNSYMSKAAKGIVAGFGTDSYRLAILGLANIFGAKATSASAKS